MVIIPHVKFWLETINKLLIRLVHKFEHNFKFYGRKYYSKKKIKIIIQTYKINTWYISNSSTTIVFNSTPRDFNQTVTFFMRKNFKIL